MPAAHRFVLCVPDLELSFYWTRFRVEAREMLADAGFDVEECPARSTAHQGETLAALTLDAGDVLALRPLERDQPALLPHLARLGAAGVRLLLMGELAGLPEGLVHARVQSDHAEGLARGAAGVVSATTRRALLLGETPHARVVADTLRARGLPAGVTVVEALPCLSSAPDALRAHGRDQVAAAIGAGRLANGDLVLAVEDALALGALDAADGALTVFGAGATPDGLRAIHEGRLAASLFFEPAAWADALVAALAAPPGRIVQLNAVLVDAACAAAFEAAHARWLVATLEETMSRARVTGQAAAFFETVVENMPVMLFVKRLPDLRVEFVNRERERWLGLPRDRILGRTAHEFLPAKMADLMTARDHEALMARSIVDEAVDRVVRPDGSARYVLTRKIPLFDANGRPSHLIGISLDVTERELAERELQAAHLALKENQNKLLIAEKMAALGRLTAGIAHEMNTPLAAIRAALSELEALVTEYEDSLGDADVTVEDHRQIAAEMRHSAGLAARSAQRAASFVRSINHHTRNQGNHERVRFALLPALEESVLLLDHQFKRSQCTARIEVADAGLKVEGTPGGLGQVITNLLGNALDAGAHAIAIRAAPTAAGIELTVRDDGSGIAAEDLGRIFEPMFTTKPFGQGTGLGLAIVHDIVVEQFGGTIDVDSAPGAGTCFTLRFPLPTHTD